MHSKNKNEFLRSRPAQKNKKIIYDFANFAIPIIIVLIGIVVSAQKFAALVRYNPYYCGDPLFITTKEFFNLKPGYPIFNPAFCFLSLFSKPFDETINNVMMETLLPLVALSVFAIFLFLFLSFLRGRNFNKNDNLYGTSRWATEKDLKKNGLCQTNGVILWEQQSADVDAKIRQEDPILPLYLL